MNKFRKIAAFIRASNALQLAALVLFVLGLSGLVLAATLSVSTVLLKTALGVFGLCTLLWIIVQFVCGRVVPFVQLIIIGGALVVIGGVILVIYYFLLGTPSVGVHHADRVRDALPLIGWVTLYLGFGWLIEALREARWRRWWFSAAVFVGGLVLAGLAVWLLPHSTKGSYIALIAVLAIALAGLLPIGLNLLSEDALDTIVATGRDARLVALIGAALFAVPLVVTGFVTHSWLAVGVLALVALVLLFAIASDTHLDTAIVIAAIAVLAAAPLEVAQPADLKSGTGQSALIAFGDSYMSGEGAQKFISGTDEGGADECRRAPTAYAALAAGPGKPFDALTFLACSGARTFNVIATQDDPDGSGRQTGEPGTQVDQVRKIMADNPSFHPKLAIVSLGGNDAGFASIGEMCLLPGNCATQRALFEDNLSSVGKALAATYASIRFALPNVPIVAVPYPQPVASASSCGNKPLSASERAFVQQFVGELDNTIKAAAAQEHVYYMDTMTDSLAKAHLQLCDPTNHGKPGLNTVSLNSVNGAAGRRLTPEELVHDSLHPNERGHAAMLTAFESWLTANPSLSSDGPSDTAPASATPATATAVADTKPPCSLTSTGDTNCGNQARQWELKELVGWWWLAFPAFIALAGGWLISVAGLSRFPRHKS